MINGKKGMGKEKGIEKAKGRGKKRKNKRGGPKVKEISNFPLMASLAKKLGKEIKLKKWGRGKKSSCMEIYTPLLFLLSV